MQYVHTGAYYTPGRTYDPYTGRYLQQDRTDFNGGDSKLYRSAGNTPLDAVDPSGESPMGYQMTPNGPQFVRKRNTAPGQGRTSG